jgi:hypothetical protein
MPLSRLKPATAGTWQYHRRFIAAAAMSLREIIISHYFFLSIVSFSVPENRHFNRMM